MKGIDSIKAEVMTANITRKAATDERLHESLRVMPESKMHVIIQRLHNDIIPKLISNRGEQHEDTKFFQDCRDSLIWALHALGRYDEMQNRLYNVTMIRDYLTERNKQLEKELDKYQALEDVIINQTLEDYKSVIRNKLLNA